MARSHTSSARRFEFPALLLAGCFLSAAACRATPPSVTTQHNDNARTGANLQETLLTPANVAVSTFGKLFTRTLDANVNGQVLYVPQLTIQGIAHNVIFAYTSNNTNTSPCSVYAFDADDPNAQAPLWRHVLPLSAQWTTATPVIDPATNTMYVLTKDNDDNGATRLRALDLLTGNEKTGSPITVQAAVPGTGDGSVNGVVSFDTTHANCRPGLLLLNGVVYIAFAHNSDSFPYHGWVFGYSYDQTKFTRTAVFCTNPNGGLDGIWMAGKGLAADANSIYCSVGNGTFDVPAGGTSYGMCYLKLNAATLTVADWFAPFDEQPNSDADLDLGNSGVTLIPGTTRLFGGGTKFGSVFLMDSTAMGRFTPNGPDKVVQRFDHLMPNDQVGQNAVVWNAGAAEYVYLWPGGTNLLQFKYDPAVSKFNPAGPFKQTAGLTSGGSLTVTANGAGNGILWAVGGDHVFHAFDATDVTRPELWNSALNPGRDALPSVGHFQFPTVVNGKAYVPTGSGSVAVYGLLANGPPGPPAPPTHVSATAGNAQVTLNWTASAGATSYHVKRATVNGGPYATVGSPATATFTDAPLTNGTTYYYVVTAVNASGESAASAQVSAVPSAQGGGLTLSSLTVNPTTVKSYVRPRGTVTMSGVVKTGSITVNLTSSNPAVAKPPPTVTVWAGASTRSFDVVTARAAQNTVVTLSATYAGVTQTCTLTVTPK